jgi:hypothetical protein
MECPECHTMVRVGTVGYGNLKKQHIGMQACKRNLEAYIRAHKSKPNKSIHDFFTNKAPLVPSSVEPSEAIPQANNEQLPISVDNVTGLAEWEVIDVNEERTSDYISESNPLEKILDSMVKCVSMGLVAKLVFICCFSSW